MNAWSPFRLLAPAGPRGRLSIFIFHRVLPVHDPLLPWEPDAARFETIVRFIARHFHVLHVAEAAKRLAAGNLPAASACITFDDGYADNLTVATPILRRHGVTGTVFVATGFTDGGRMWNDTVIESARLVPDGTVDWSDLELGRHEVKDVASRIRLYEHVLGTIKYWDKARREEIVQEIGRRTGLPERACLMMTRAQLRALRAEGIEVGGHTATHPILAKLDEQSAAREIGQGRAELGEWLGEMPTVFAYPNGVPDRDYTRRDVELVRRAGYSAAVSTARGGAGPGADLLQLPRFTPWDRSMPRFALRCAQTLLQRGFITAGATSAAA